MPKVTVVIPTRNRPDLVVHAKTERPLPARADDVDEVLLGARGAAARLVDRLHRVPAVRRLLARAAGAGVGACWEEVLLLMDPPRSRVNT